jgi:Tfp pilus assembly protein PilO
MSQILVPLALLVSSIGLYFSYISPTYDSLVQHNVFITRLEEAKKQYDTFVSQKSKLTGINMGISKENLANLTKIMPDEVDSVRFIIDLDAIARANSMSISEFSLPGDATVGTTPSTEGEGVGPKFAKEEFAVALTGDYQNFKRFLRNIESSLALMTVTQVAVDASGDSENAAPGVYEYQVAFQTYELLPGPTN